MSELSAKVAALKGKRRTTHLIKGVDISRATFRKIELGQPIKLSTLKEVAKALGVFDDSPDWLELVVAWIKTEVGYDAQRLWIEPKEHPGMVRDAQATDVTKATYLFSQLNAAERADIIKAMERPEVRACLPAINRVWEKLGRPSITTVKPLTKHTSSMLPASKDVILPADLLEKDAEQRAAHAPSPDKPHRPSTPAPHPKSHRSDEPKT